MRMPLYLRIWLAVIAAVAVITLVFGWLWRINADERRPMRELIVRNEAGEVLGQFRGRPEFVPGEGVEFPIAMKDGGTLYIQLPPRPRPPGAAGPRPGMRGSDGLIWTLGIVALAVALGSYPIIRRLTKRLEALRAGVERWGEGDLSARVDESGTDEAAALARRFNHAAARVQDLVASHRSLLANASHELRSPLARIRMGLALMGENGSRSETARAEIERNIDELDQLVEEILLASRLDTRGTDIGAPEPVDLTGLAAEECARADAELVTAEDGQPVVVEGVPRLLRRLVRNLLENARRYSQGRVTVELRASTDGAVVRVCDQGPGVPPAQRERIFEPFYRLPGASERFGGVGLGLALVRSITQRHGGQVHCEDNPGGHGACFVVSLPRRAAPLG